MNPDEIELLKGLRSGTDRLAAVTAIRPSVRLWPILVLAGSATVILGTSGFYKAIVPLAGAESSTELALRMLDSLYRTIQLFVLEFDRTRLSTIPWELQAARFAAPAIGVIAAMQAILLVFREHADRVRARLLRRHVIVCGVGEHGLRLLSRFRGRGHRVAAIDSNPDSAKLGMCRSFGVPLLSGDATHPRTLRRAGVFRASYLVTAMGSDDLNAEAAAKVKDLVRRRVSPLTCIVQIKDRELWRLLRHDEFRARRAGEPVRIDYVNPFEAGAHLMLERFPPFPAEEDLVGKPPRVLVAGLGRLGESLLIHVARSWRAVQSSRRAVLAVVDREASSKVSALRNRFPKLDDSIEIRCHDIDVRSPAIDGADLELFDGSESVLTNSYVCFGDDALSITTALLISGAVPVQDPRPKLVFRVNEESGLASLLPMNHGLSPFAFLDRICTPDLLTGGITETVARALHAAYVRHEGRRGVPPGENPSLVPWDELHQALREQNRDQADSMAAGLAARGYRLMPLTDWDAWRFRFPDADVEHLARGEHQRWMRVARRQGYRPGATKDHRRKTHPSLVPWTELREEDRDKDRMFVREWPVTLFHAGLQIEGPGAGASDA